MCRVALGQVERLDELIGVRLRAAKVYRKLASAYSGILVPQQNHEGSINTYWTWTAKINDKVVSWHDFKSLFVKAGGDPFYGAWALTYNEPFVKNMTLFGRDAFLTDNGRANWKNPDCPNAEMIQKRLCQFQTNIFSDAHLEKQANALEIALKSVYG